VGEGSKQCQVGSLDIELKIVRQAVIQFEVRGVLSDGWVLKMLESIDFIEEFEAPLSLIGD
jgi:hypothetical protein